MRVPLIFPMLATIERIDTAATAAVNPPGEPSSGYDRDLREPYPYISGTSIVDTRRYMTAFDIPVQVEFKKFEEIREEFSGDSPDSNMILVLHHMHLEALGLLSSGRCLIEKGSRISGLKSRLGAQSLTPRSPLYIFEVRPDSQGFGPSGFDLELVFTHSRPPALRGGD